MHLDLVANALEEETTDTPVPVTPATITLAWLVRLRWGAAIGQTATIATAVVGFGLELPLRALAILVGITLASNLALALWLKQARDVLPHTIGGVLAADIVVLTGLLYYS